MLARSKALASSGAAAWLMDMNIANATMAAVAKAPLLIFCAEVKYFPALKFA